MQTHRYLILAGCGLLLALVPAPAPAEAIGPEPKARSLYVTVERDGGLIRGLTERNFRLRVDGEPVRFQLAEPETPITIALLVEYSRASWYYFNDIARAVEGFLNAAPEGNWYALATFDKDLQVQTDFTRQRGELLGAIQSAGQPMRREVNTYDAVWEMLDKLGRLPGRRVLILIGSGADTFSGNTLGDVQRKIETSDVTVFAAGAGSVFRTYYEPYMSTAARMNLLRAEAFLRMLADKSGGEAWFPRFETAFPNVMRGILQTLDHQYRLEVEPIPPRPGRYRKIEAEAFVIEDDRRRDFKVRVREGWRE